MRALAGVGLAVVAALAVWASAQAAQPHPASPRGPYGPVAVALVQRRGGSELVVVDLETFSVARRVALRSLCLSIDGDPATRVVATAQCGGPDRSADSACGIFTPDLGGAVRYVELGVPNPLEVAVARDRAYLVHGFEQSQGVCTSFVGLGDRPQVTRGHVSSMARRPLRTGSEIVLSVEAGAGDAPDPEQFIMPADSVSRTPVGRFAGDSVGVLAVDEDDGALFATVATCGAAETNWEVHRIHESGKETVRAVAGVRKGLFAAAVVGAELVLADADGLDLRDPGRTLIFLDAHTLQERRRVRIAGMPAALAGWRGNLLVFDGVSGELLKLEPGTSVAAESLDLGGPQLGGGDLVVFDVRPTDARTRLGVPSGQ